MKLRRSIRITVPLAVAAVALSAASLAWACTVRSGQTYINASADVALNGTGELGQDNVAVNGRAVAPNSPIVVYADDWSNANPANGTSWALTRDSVGQHCDGLDPAMSSVPASVTLKRDPNVPDIGPVASIALVAQGSHKVCFYHPDSSAMGGGYSTEPAVLTVL